MGDCSKGSSKGLRERVKPGTTRSPTLKGPPLTQNSAMQMDSLFYTTGASHYCIKTQHQLVAVVASAL